MKITLLDSYTQDVTTSILYEDFSDPEQENIPPSDVSEISYHSVKIITTPIKKGLTTSKTSSQNNLITPPFHTKSSPNTQLTKFIHQQDQNPFKVTLSSDFESREPENDSQISDMDYTRPVSEPAEVTCISLALEGEKLCMQGDCVAGIKCFDQAIQIGTEDVTVISAIYSQMGNAYFYLNNFEKALEYHKYDYIVNKKSEKNFTTSKILDNPVSKDNLVKQATALSNLCNTYKCLNKFEEAIKCGIQALDLSKKLQSSSLLNTAYYNLGNIYHSVGKKIMTEQIGISCMLNNSQFHVNSSVANFYEELKNNFALAIKNYEQNLLISQKIKDKVSEGRALGQLGNVNYRLGNWDSAVEFHEERLKIAIILNDVAAERRALANLANSHAGAGRIEVALDYYKKALQLSKKSKEPEAEAQACWSLAAAYNLIGNYDLAIMYQRHHLDIAKNLNDKVGEQKAWSNLVPLYKKIDQTSLALVGWLKIYKTQRYNFTP